jgi:hypothetical protein
LTEKKPAIPINEEEELEEEEEQWPETEEEEVVIPQIDYQILVFLLAELAKPKSRREPKL